MTRSRSSSPKGFRMKLSPDRLLQAGLLFAGALLGTGGTLGVQTVTPKSDPQKLECKCLTADPKIIKIKPDCPDVRIERR